MGDLAVRYPKIATDSTIYVVGTSGYVDGDLYALASSGTLKWRKGNASGGHSIAIAANGTIYGSLVSSAGTSLATVNSDGLGKMDT